MESWKKVVVVLFLFLLIFVSSFWLMGDSNDDDEHKAMALDFGYSPHYNSWFRFMSQYFAGNDFLWLLMGFVVVGVLAPVTLYFITKNFWVFFFYFFGSNYFLVLWGTGLYPQALTVFFGLLLVLFRKSLWKQGLVFLLGFGVHGFAPIFLSIVWGLLLLQRVSPWVSNTLKVLGCSPIFGHNSPKMLSAVIGEQSPGNHFTLSTFSSFFLKMCPLPFLFVAFVEWIREKEFWPFALLGLLLIGAVLQFNERVLWSFAPFVWLGFMPFFERSAHKRAWVFLALVVGLVNYYLFVRLRFGVGC